MQPKPRVDVLPTGINLFLAAVAYYILQQVIVATHGKESKLAQALGRDIKGLSSLGLYALAIGLSFWYAPLAWT